MNINALINKTKVLVVVILTFCIVLSPVSARTIEEINAEIEANKAKLEQLNSQLDEAKSNYNSAREQANGKQSELQKVVGQINELQYQHDYYILQKEQLENELSLKELEKEVVQEALNDQLVASYINWKTNDASLTILGNNGDLFKNVIYLEILSQNSQNQISALNQDVNRLNEQTIEFQEQAAKLAVEMEEMVKQREFLQKQVDAYNQALAEASKVRNDILGASTQIQKFNESLTKELQVAIDAEKTYGDINSGTQPFISGEVYFAGSITLPTTDSDVCRNIGGTGTQQYEDAFGHGVGMSQFGAYGAALNRGWNAAQILGFYYSGTNVATVNNGLRINVSFNGSTRNLTMDDYVAGLGEVPDRACGTMEQINNWNASANALGWASDDTRRNKYVLDNPNSIYDCWPEEAIKAQVIAARSYAYSYAASGSTICSSASCQVYDGTKDKAWAAWETSNQYVQYQGGIINALYSGFNSNSKGTADNDTRWCSMSGNCSTVPYLRSVDDSSFTYIPVLCNQRVHYQNWNTNSYSINQLNEMINWCSNSGNCSISSWVRTNIKNKIGTLSSISVTRDNSGRAKRITFAGTNGQATISGIYFRVLFNTWASQVAPKGVDKLQSITFNLFTAQ